MYDYGYVIVASWLVLIAVWVVGSFTSKRDVSNSPRIFFWLRSILLLGLLIFALWNLYLYDHTFLLEQMLFNLGPAIGWIGTLLTVIGVTFAIWARFSLGRNWGSRPKVGQVLVTSGPYAYIRHPIYTGAVLALFGSALTGSMVAVAFFVISIPFCLRRIKKEEPMMLSLFPEQYPTYRACTKRFIPLVW